MNAKKRILSVKIKYMIDDSPDTSYLGEYSSKPTSEFSIDRAHSEDCASLRPLSSDAIETLNHASDYLNSLRIDSELDTSSDMELQTAIATIEGLLSEYENPDCDCNGGDMGRNEYRYFNPSFNYVDKQGKPTDGLTPEEARKYTRQDYERMESLNRGDWSYIGVRAEAEIGIGDLSAYPTKYDCTIQHIRSGGLWGIESDSPRVDLEEIEQQELSELKSQLKALGFTTRAISAAFKNIEKEND